jgi:hypothetical protein
MWRLLPWLAQGPRIETESEDEAPEADFAEIDRANLRLSSEKLGEG